MKGGVYPSRFEAERDLASLRRNSRSPVTANAPEPQDGLMPKAPSQKGAWQRLAFKSKLASKISVSGLRPKSLARAGGPWLELGSFPFGLEAWS